MSKKIRAKKIPPPVASGHPEAGIPKIYSYSIGEQGVARSSAFGMTISARQLYAVRKRHAYVSAVHNAIIKQVKKVELYIAPIDPKKPFNEETKKRMEQFIKTGFGPFGEKEWRGRMMDTKKWYGDAFSEIIFNPTTTEPSLVNYIIAETMRILPDEHGQIIGYPQVVDGSLAFTFNPKNIMHLKEHDDEYSFFGFSDLESLFSALLMDTLAEEHTISKLRNDAMPSGILCGDNEDLDEKAIARLRAQFIQQLRQNPNRPVMLNRKLQWIPLAPTGLKDMDFQELHHNVKEKIMMVYGVLPMQLAVVETGKLANPEQQLEIGEEYIRQELESIQSMYNMKLTPNFQNSENLMFCFRELDPKLEVLEKQAAVMNVKANTARTLAGIPGTFTKNEIRAIVDHEPLPVGGDEVIAAQLPDPTAFKKKALETKPMGPYSDFADCVSQNSDKENPEAYCASIMNSIEGSEADTEQKALNVYKLTRAQGQKKMMDDLDLAYAKFLKKALAIARKQYPEKKGLATLIFGRKSITDFTKLLSPLLVDLKDALELITQDNSRKIYSTAKEGLGFAFDQKDEKTILNILTRGKGAFDGIKSFTDAQKEGLVGTMNAAFDEGKSIPAMIKDMREYADLETYKLERIARTESHRMAYQGRFSGYKDLEEKRGETYVYDWVGPDDEKTSEECKSILDGNPYSLEELNRLTDGGVVHPNERHVIVRRVQ